jgi:pyruvate formate lyase activating enzyme
MADGEKIPTDIIEPEELVKHAYKLKSRGNIGIAYTYNEPFISFEYVRDCALLAREKGLKNVAVTNGYICKEPLLELLPLIDAMNIDLKAFSDSFYKKMCGDLETVKTTIQLAAGQCHVEVTNLVIPGENDTDEEMEQLSMWLASINPKIPLHITRFFPRWKMVDRGATPLKTIYGLAGIARKHLKYVYEGNI